MTQTTNPAEVSTIAVLVENKTGVLARVADLFARRSFNIISLTVAPTRDERLSRITIVVDVESSPLEQIINQLFKLINVVEITELDVDEAIERELLLATIEAPEKKRDELSELVDKSYGKVLSAADNQMTISIEDKPSRINAFEVELQKYDVTYLQRSGRIALPKIGRSIRRHRAD